MACDVIYVLGLITKVWIVDGEEGVLRNGGDVHDCWRSADIDWLPLKYHHAMHA